jgi:RNA recognition motif-containing protein
MKNIFVGNLNSSTTTEAVRSLFGPLGTVRRCKMMTDRDTGVSRGFAFIEMTDAEATQAIAALNGRIVDGRTIQVREGRERLHSGRSPRRETGQAGQPRVPQSSPAIGQAG